MNEGGCHCGAIRYRVEGAPIHAALCHCTDCRRHAGAPMVGWTLFGNDRFAVTKGEAKVYASSEHGRRHFCADCGTGLFYTNETIFAGQTDVQVATLDDPDALPMQAQIQTAERIGWMKAAHDLPAFERFPSQA
ncbi:GFA family protein [Sphingosinicella sp.]|uniref:GFA family protein n=1 Tax=Sphingosinicella sp. TaxID=1917971 RepID=UPI00403771B3